MNGYSLSKQLDSFPHLVPVLVQDLRARKLWQSALPEFATNLGCCTRHATKGMIQYFALYTYPAVSNFAVVRWESPGELRFATWAKGGTSPPPTVFDTQRFFWWLAASGFLLRRASRNEATLITSSAAVVCKMICWSCSPIVKSAKPSHDMLFRDKSRVHAVATKI